MGWESSRPVPWRRLTREWLLYAAIMAAVFVLFFRNDNMVGALIGILVSAPLYLGFGALMAKFGYQRERLGRRSARASAADAEPSSGSSAGSSTDIEKSRPAPTKRTSTGSNRPVSSSKRNR